MSFLLKRLRFILMRGRFAKEPLPNLVFEPSYPPYNTYHGLVGALAVAALQVEEGHVGPVVALEEVEGGLYLEGVGGQESGEVLVAALVAELVGRGHGGENRKAIDPSLTGHQQCLVTGAGTRDTHDTVSYQRELLTREGGAQVRGIGTSGRRVR